MCQTILEQIKKKYIEEVVLHSKYFRYQSGQFKYGIVVEDVVVKLESYTSYL